MSQSMYHRLQDAVDHLHKARIILAGLDFEESDAGKFMLGSASATHDYCNKILREMEKGITK